MTIGCLEFDGDSHTSVRYFLGMTMLFDARFFLDKFLLFLIRKAHKVISR